MLRRSRVFVGLYVIQEVRNKSHFPLRFSRVLDFVHHPGLKTRTGHFGNWMYFCPQLKVEDACSVGFLRKS
jgi:hypothetical protein